MASSRREQKRYLAILDRLEPSLRRQVQDALNLLARSISIDALVEAIVSGDQTVLARITRTLSRALKRAVATVERAYEVGRSSASASVPQSWQASLSTTNPLALRAAATSSARLVTNVTSETRRAIRGVIQASYAEGLAPRDAARLIKPLVGLTERQAKAVLASRTRDIARGLTVEQVDKRAAKYSERLLKQRAEMIARTEILRSGNQGQVDLWRQAEQNGLMPLGSEKEWLVADDDRLCPECEPLGGVSVPIDESFPGGVDSPPLHPNCLLPDSLVLAGGRVAAVSHRHFDGDVVVIHTASGKRLACTPNHPVLTESGWIPARDANVVGHVIGRRFSDGPLFARREHDQHMPSTIHEVAEACGRASEMSARPVPVSAEDFHGDGLGSEVAVVWTDRLLVDDIDAAIAEQFGKMPFHAGDVEALALDRLRASAFLVEGMFASDDGGVSGFDLHPTFACGHPRPLQELSFAAGPQRDASRPQPSLDSLTADAQLAGEIVNGSAGHVFRDQVIGVESQSFHGEVLNAETSVGAYVADEIINHNCRCTLVLSVPASARRAA